MSSQPSPLLEDQPRTPERSFSIFLPFMLGFTTAAPPSQNNEAGENSTVPERIVLINPFTGSLVMVQGFGIMDLSNKDGPSPASKASIEAMPVVNITEQGLECAICLAEFEVGGEAREMPCKHRYHSGCIEKWLGIHGSCPICRYMMPVEEDEGKMKEGDGNGVGNGGRRVDGEMRISFLYVSDSDRRDSNSSSVSNSHFDNSSISGESNDAIDTDGS
ncbi:RING-type E3 ubiquitin transferase [Sarracenia purpurea var. burkii]